MQDLKTAAWACVPPLAAFLTQAGPDALPLCPSEPVTDAASMENFIDQPSSYSTAPIKPATTGQGAASSVSPTSESSLKPCVENTWWERFRRQGVLELIFSFTTATVSLMGLGLLAELAKKRSWLIEYVDEAKRHFLVAYLLARHFVDRPPRLRAIPIRTLDDAEACRTAIQELDEAIAIYKRHGLDKLKWVWNVRVDEEYRFMCYMRDELDKKTRAFAEDKSQRRSERSAPGPVPTSLEVKKACAVLGVIDADTMSYEQARSAFRNMAKKVHPDRNSNDPNADKKFKEVYAAFETLCRVKGWQK